MPVNKNVDSNGKDVTVDGDPVRVVHPAQQEVKVTNTDFATQTTLALIKAKTDKLTVTGVPDVAEFNPDGTGAGASIYEPAAGKIWRIHTLHITNNDGASRSFSVSTTDGTTIITILPTQAINTGANYLHEINRDVFFSNSVGLRIYCTACTAVANIIYRIAYEEYDA